MDRGSSNDGGGDHFAAPAPRGRSAAEKLSEFLGEGKDSYWAEQSVRVSSDMLLVCDEGLTILFHNRALLRFSGHREGSYVGFSLLQFFPVGDRGDAEAAFAGLVHGRSGGIRIQADMLHASGPIRVEARATRTRAAGDRVFLYLVIREALPQRLEPETPASTDTILEGLPIAAFRADGQLKVTHVSGSLWNDLGLDPARIMGADLSSPRCPLTPAFLHEIDFCDTMAGLSFQTALEWKNHNLIVAIEPFVDLGKRGKVTGMLGLVRLAKKSELEHRNDHLQYPNPADFTRPLQSRPFQNTDRVALSAMSPEADEIARIRATLNPTPLRPSTSTGPVILSN